MHPSDLTAIAAVHFGDLPAVRLSAADGACATVTLFGAQLVSWRTADGAEQLFCSDRSARDGSRAIRGGVPLIFPQFNERGPIVRHGFARTSNWSLVDSGVVAADDANVMAADDGGDAAGAVAAAGAIYAVFALDQSALAPARAAEWPHAFALRLRVQLHGAQLALTLDVDNTGSTPFSFSAALHTYHRVADIDAVRIDGVQAQPLAVGEALDAIFSGVAGRGDSTAGTAGGNGNGSGDGDITLHDGARRLHSWQSGFRDCVVWNPGQAACAAAADMAPQDYRHFVCIEPALIDGQQLAPGQRWRGHNLLRVAG